MHAYTCGILCGIPCRHAAGQVQVNKKKERERIANFPSISFSWRKPRIHLGCSDAGLCVHPLVSGLMLCSGVCAQDVVLHLFSVVPAFCTPKSDQKPHSQVPIHIASRHRLRPQLRPQQRDHHCTMHFCSCSRVQVTLFASNTIPWHVPNRLRTLKKSR